MDQKQNLLTAISKNGWHLTPESIEDFLHEKSNLNSNDLVKLALNADLRNIGAKFLSDTVVTGKAETFEGPAVLQIVKLRNIGAPKEHETSMGAPAMYKLTLTDGTGNCNALVIDNNVNNLNLNTPPGTKILLKGVIKLKSNLLILTSQNIQVLGGHVEYLVTKWKQAKDLAQHIRSAILTETAPPPWVPFGARQTNQVDTSKKVFAQNESQAQEDGSEFSLARQAALAEAMEAKLKITKTFTQTTVDKTQIENAVPSTSSEYRPQTSAASASHAPPRTHNSASISSGGPIERGKPAGRGRGRGRRGRNFDDDDDDDPREAKDAAKPSAVTLFDLIKTKVDIKGGADEAATKEPERERQEESQYEDSRRGGFSRGGRNSNDGYNSRGGRGRGARNQHQRLTTETPASSTSKQVYDADDFSYELGDTTNVKNLKQNKPNVSKPAKTNPEVETPAVTSKQANTTYNKNNSSSYNSESNRRGDNSNRDNQRDRYRGRDNDNNNYDDNRPESSNYQGRNNNPKFNKNYNNAPSSRDTNYEASRGYDKRQDQQKRNYNSSGPSNYNNDQPASGNYNKNPNKEKNYPPSNRPNNNDSNNGRHNNQQQQYYQQAQPAQASNTVVTSQALLPPPQTMVQTNIIYQPPYIPKNQQASVPNTYYNEAALPPQANYEYYPGQPQMIPAQIGALPVNQPFYQPMLAAPYPPNSMGYYAAPMPVDNMYTSGSYSGTNEQNSSRQPQREPRQWKVGDQCIARYRDNEYYPAVIQKVLKNGNRYLVNYSDYDETHEVGLNDLQAKAYYNSNNKNYNKNYSNNSRPSNSAGNNNNRRNNQ